MICKKKILIFSDNNTFGGSEVIIKNLLNNSELNTTFEIKFAFRDHLNYTKYAYKKINDQSKLIPIILLSNINLFIYLDKIDTFYSKLLYKLLNLLDRLGLYSIINFFILYFKFLKYNPDILFINNGGYPGSDLCRLSVIVGKSLRIDRVIFNVNNMAFPPSNIFQKINDKVINSFVDIFITASIAAKRQLIEVRGIDENKFRTIPNSVEDVSKNIFDNNICNSLMKNNKIILGSIGMLSVRKGYEYLIKAIDLVVKQNQNFILYIVGTGEEEFKLQQIINEYKLGDFIKLLGFKDNPLDYLKCFDLFILPSISNEDMPYVIIEAMMLHKPVIGTNVAGIPEEILNNLTGFVVEKKNIYEMSNAIILLLENNILRSTFGEKGYEHYLTNFEQKLIIKEYNLLFSNQQYRN